jgi:hypothetical protein
VILLLLSRLLKILQSFVFVSGTVGTIFHRRIQAICSHVYREGNCCADKLTAFGHSITGAVSIGSLPQSLAADFFRDCVGLSNYRFP